MDSRRIADHLAIPPPSGFGVFGPDPASNATRPRPPPPVESPQPQSGAPRTVSPLGNPAPNASSSIDNPSDLQLEQESSGALDESILQLLGSRLRDNAPPAPPIHADLMVRLEDVVSAGLPSAELSSLLSKYPPPENCQFLRPPRLNEAVKAAVEAPALRRDELIMAKQLRLSACISAGSKALSALLSLPDISHVLPAVEGLADLSRGLVDLFRDESLCRRRCILPSLKASFRSSLSASSIDEFLFGSKLEETIKTAKAVEISSKQLKPPSRTSKNGGAPPRRQSPSLLASKGGQHSSRAPVPPSIELPRQPGERKADVERRPRQSAPRRRGQYRRRQQ